MATNPLSPQQQAIAQAVIDAMNGDPRMQVLYGIRTGKTFVFNYLDRYLSSRPQPPSLEGLIEFIHKNPLR